MIRSTVLCHTYLSRPHTFLRGGLGVSMQFGAALLWQVSGAELIRRDRRFGIYSSDEKLNLDRANSGWRFAQAPM